MRDADAFDVAARRDVTGIDAQLTQNDAERHGPGDGQDG